ncbi:MAG: diguanylate cyclase domain-containing protein, partial [Candidatus Sericytochromatia bacterium]
ENPDLVIMDWEMPIMNGLELCKYIRAKSNVPILMLTARKDIKDKLEGFDSGINDFLSKPFDSDELWARVKALIKSYELIKLAYIDGLTGIANRRSFNEYIKREWESSLIENKSLSLILIDVDHFKLFNDHYGHLSGDDILIKISNTCNNLFQNIDCLFARYGGEEFAVILSNINHQEALNIAKQINKTVFELSIPHEKSKDYGVVTISLGVTTKTPSNDSSYSDLIELADNFLYQAKKNGRNTYYSEYI